MPMGAGGSTGKDGEAPDDAIVALETAQAVAKLVSGSVGERWGALGRSAGRPSWGPASFKNIWSTFAKPSRRCKTQLTLAKFSKR